ncbi:MAG: DUF1844 domain-containing protein [Planctomycetes bacterium]|nr:DUF1844 domain-containing protein [Planctomycetota bacterium]
MSIILPGSGSGSGGAGPSNANTASNASPAAPKIVVDSDWKSQAQAEKEKLNAEAQAAAQAKVAATPAGKSKPGSGEPAQLTDLVSMLVTQALMYMGGIPDPRTGQAVVALDYAKIYIDMLGVLEEKTKGNLTPDEEKMLSQTAHELRMEFVEVGAAIAQAVKEGKIKPQQLGGSAGAMGLGSTSGVVSSGGAGGISGPGLS